MNRFAICLLCLTATPALAVDPPPPPAKPVGSQSAQPKCGKDAAECQKTVDALTARVQSLSQAYQFVRQQRDEAAQAVNDAQVNNYMQQQEAAQKAAAPPK